MFQRMNCRPGHYLLLVTVGALLFLPNLGGPSLWDIDEGNNVEASREMWVSGNWIVPTFNFELRVDKPVLLYWLQIGAFRLFGVNEFAGRLPSALAALAGLLLTYELGRRMFGAVVGLLAGLMLASTILFCAAAHFANPDAVLNACTLLTFLFFWNSFARQDGSWFVLCGIASGLAMLSKGPVGLVLPSAVALLFLFWAGQLRRLLDWRLFAGMLAFGLVMVPWYAWVGAETRGNFLRGFFLTHNVDRYLSPMEGHAGGPGYYLLVLAVGFAPWSAFLGLTLWYSLKFPHAAWAESSRPTPAASPPCLAEGGREDSAHAVRTQVNQRSCVAFLWCWIVVYFAFFSASGTKLPNYVLPIYPAIALLTARFLERWRRAEVQPPAWTMHVALACLALVGVGTMGALLLAGGAWAPRFFHGRHYAGLEKWMIVGAIPVLGAVAAWRCLWTDRRTGMVLSVALSGVAFLGLLAAGGAGALEAYKAPRKLVRDIRADLTEQEVRVGAYDYFQPSLVFYCRRAVHKLQNENEMMEFLNYPLPVYLFLPESRWAQVQPRVPGTCRLLARQFDLYRHCDVVLVTNR